MLNMAAGKIADLRATVHIPLNSIKKIISIFRTHTVILIDGNNKVDFYEQTMASADPAGEWTSTHFQTEFSPTN